MTDNTTHNPNLEDLLNSIRERLSRTPQDAIELHEVALDLIGISDRARESSQMALARGADFFSRIFEVAGNLCGEFSSDEMSGTELVEFGLKNLPALVHAANVNDECGEVDSLIQLAREKWNDCLPLFSEDEKQDNLWELSTEEFETPTDAVEAGTESDQELPEGQIELMLAAISEVNSESSSQSTEDDDEVARPTARENSTTSTDVAAKNELINDRELLEAYLDDAVRCLSAMEQAALAIEDSPRDLDSIQKFCRELHTLKGASATVGLSHLASFLHDLESTLEVVFKEESGDLEVELLFDAVDRMRVEIGSLQNRELSEPQASAGENPQKMIAEPAAARSDFANLAFSDDNSIRIRAAKLDRLMDMLAELVVLRNRRENHVSDFNQFNEELARCASRLSFAEEQSKIDFSCEMGPASLSTVNNSSSTFSEVAKDITAVSQAMRELQKPVSHDNASISRFIRDFRQELMQLRRIPVSGLFNRLQRAARDAAKSENKQVQVKLVGEQAGLEQEIQERLFESLLHIVRNSVSHGVESQSKRTKAGKDPVGTITLEASSSAQLLIIEVRDDGNGLDYEAVRRRAIEKGLIAANHRSSKAELAKLIFHPGFSTREQASEVSGRGVGMDIVAKTIEQLHGRIEVDSVAGEGTTMRLMIPLRTGIEHVMVFRVSDQLFAIPMQSVTAAKSSAPRPMGTSSGFPWHRHSR